jgi:hypothetical protein
LLIAEAFHFFLLIVGEGGNSRGIGMPADLLSPSAYHAGLGREGDAIPASRTARIPVRKMPSNVPAPPIEATGAPRPLENAKLNEDDQPDSQEEQDGEQTRREWQIIHLGSYGR